MFEEDKGSRVEEGAQWGDGGRESGEVGRGWITLPPQARVDLQLLQVG